MGSQSKLTGKLGEMLALKYLSQKGYHLIRQNYYIRGGEIDLILKKDNMIVFTEVKTRKNDKFGTPEESLTNKKKHKLLRAIKYYLGKNFYLFSWRCDLITIQFITSHKAKIKHITNIFNE